MLRRSLYLFLVFFYFGIYQLFAVDPGNDLRIWSELNRLKQSDFLQAVPEEVTEQKLSRGRSMTLEGYIYTGIQFNYEGENKKIIYSAEAFMDPAKSWLRDKLDLETLRHEQAHFDITEIYTRKLKKELSTAKNTAIAKRIYQQNFIELKQEQKRFDNDHKGETGIEPKWELKIKNQLEDLKEWSLKSIVTTIR